MSENNNYKHAGRVDFNPSTDDFVNDILSNLEQSEAQRSQHTSAKTTTSSSNLGTIKTKFENAESLYKIYNDSCSNILPHKERLKNLSWRLSSLSSTHGQIGDGKRPATTNVVGNTLQNKEERAETLENETLFGAENGLFSPLNNFHEQLHDGSFSSPDISVQGKALEKFTTISPGEENMSHYHDNIQNVGSGKNIDDMMEIDTEHINTLNGFSSNPVEPQPSFSHELDYVNQLKTITSETGIDPSFLEPQTSLPNNGAQSSSSMDPLIRTASISNFANTQYQGSSSSSSNNNNNNNINFDHQKLSGSVTDSFLPHSSFSNPMQHVGFLNSSNLSGSMNDHEVLINENGIDDDEDDDETSTPGSATFSLNPNKITSNLTFGVSSMREPGIVNINNAVNLDQVGRRNLNLASSMSRSPSISYSFANDEQTPILSGSAPLGTEGSYMPYFDKNVNNTGSFTTAGNSKISEPIGIKRMNSSNSLLKQKSFTNVHSLPSKSSSFLSTGNMTAFSAMSQPKDQTEFHSIDFRPNSLPRQGGIRKKQEVMMNSKSRRSSMSTSAGAAVFNHTPTPPPQSAESSSSPLANSALSSTNTTGRRGPSKAVKSGRAVNVKPASKEKNNTSSDTSSGNKDLNKDIECTNCHTKTTPLWRRDPTGKPLCNACGLFLKLHGVVRPLSLKSDVIKKRQRNNNAGSNIGPASQDEKGVLEGLNSKSRTNNSKTSKEKKATDAQGKNSKVSPTSRRGRPSLTTGTKSKNPDSSISAKEENSTTQHTFSFENVPNSSDFFGASVLTQTNNASLMPHSHGGSAETIVRDEKIVDKSIRGFPADNSSGFHDNEIGMKSTDVMNPTAFDQHELFFGHEQNSSSVEHEMNGHSNMTQPHQNLQFVQQQGLNSGTTDHIDIFSGFPNNQDFTLANTNPMSGSNNNVKTYSANNSAGFHNEHVANALNQHTQFAASSSSSRSPSSSAISHTNFHNGFWNVQDQSQTSDTATINESSATQAPSDPPVESSKTKSAETKNLEWLTLSL